MRLSVIVHGRNDGYMGDFLWRIQTTLNRLGRSLDGVDPDGSEAEVLLMDWGSNPSARLADVLSLEGGIARRLRYLYADPPTVRSVAPDAVYSTSHANNCAARRCRAEYILACDSDVYCPADTMRGLWDGLVAGQLGGASTRDSFFWSARRHVPRDFILGRPGVDEVDAHIAANWQSYVLDKPDPHNFAGATCALLATRAMWHEIRGLSEELVHWGFNDIDVHRRLGMRYRYGGDVETLGIKFFHLEHYADRAAGSEKPRRANVYSPAGHHQANGDNWGLRDQPVIEKSTGGWQPSPTTSLTEGP